MKLERIVPDLTVAGLRRSIDEHAAVLGLEAVMDHGWIVTLADSRGCQLNLLMRDATARENLDASIFVNDVEAACGRTVESGREIVHPLTTEEWGVTRFFYRDGSGSVINVGMHSH
ncbi:glyoxalase [Corynebacterium pilbarense]|uniref:Glyoxalase n=1 Tax=Corynebacterium pilbarense TaxID=1288393 RepID=A0A9Q4IGV4_9CORY|nr:glyoxalase [Corynebacterium pilbarense]